MLTGIITHLQGLKEELKIIKTKPNCRKLIEFIIIVQSYQP